MKYTVDACLTGLAQPFRGEEISAMAKSPVAGPVSIGPFGLEGDEQADRKHHGGEHMAVHLYPFDHHAIWREEIGDHPLLSDPGAFGSNFQVSGLLEDTVCIGDRFRCGSALLEVSQPRKPCWKIEHRFGQKGMVARIIKSGRSGLYFRVIEPGAVTAGEAIERVEGGHDGWTVARVFAALMGHQAGRSTADLAEIAALDRLSPELRERAQKILTRAG